MGVLEAEESTRPTFGILDSQKIAKDSLMIMGPT
jgi:hypothetical protein